MEGGEEATTKQPSAEGTTPSPPIRHRFNDPSTADVVLSITGNPAVKIYVHSSIVRSRAGYFAALLSDRWRQQPLDVVVPSQRLNFTVSLISGSTDTHISVLRLLYVEDISTEIDGASRAIEILPVAQELLFEDCVSACVRFLEAVPWTDEEELRVMDLIPHLNAEESRELLCRVSLLHDSGEETVDELLYEMVLGVVKDPRKKLEQENSDKCWVAKFLRDFPARELAGRALDRAFERTFNIFKREVGAVGTLSRYDRNRVSRTGSEVRAVGTALVWLVETMLELRVADNALKGWSELWFQGMKFSLNKEFWQKFDPPNPLRHTLLNCAHRLANALAAGTILAPRQMRMKLVKDWVPLLIECRENFAIMLSSDKTVCVELEETILKIMSTLPMSEAKESLQHYLRSKKLQDLHIGAFNTWFRRAMQAPR